tara:strand:+ start:23447 stop:24364 length:918 start_codon:yes stop_codon:yes gene_type:complete
MAGIGFAIAGLALSAIGTGASFAQAGASRRQQRDAESKAEAMMRQARKRLDINYMEQLSIKKEPYELQREALLQQGATALAAAQEGSQRGVAATAGRLQQAQTQAQGQVRTQMGQELQSIEKAVAEEDARLRDLNVQLDLGEIQGAQQAAADAEAKAAAQTAAGIQGAVSTVQQGIQMIPLYGQNTDAQMAAIGETEFSAEQIADIGDINGKAFDPSALGSGKKSDFRKFRRSLDPNQKNLIFGNEAFQANFAAQSGGINALTQTPQQARLQMLRQKQSAGTITEVELQELNSLLGTTTTTTITN